MPFGIGRFLRNNAGFAGTALGAGIGSIIPGAGTALGATIGGALGGALQASNRGEGLPETNPDPTGLVRSYYDDLRNPLRMLPAFQKIAASATPTADQFLTVQAATGGSQAIATEQFEAAQHRAQAGAFDAFNQYRAGADQRALQALGLFTGNNQFSADLRAEDYFSQRANRQAIGSQFLSGAAGILPLLYGRQAPGGSAPASSYTPSLLGGSGLGSGLQYR